MTRVKKSLASLALGAASLGMMALPALADQGGVPNEHACFGQATKAYNLTGPTTQGEAVREQAKNEPGPGRSGEVHAFKETCGDIIVPS